MDIVDALSVLERSIQCDDNEAHDALDCVAQFVERVLHGSADETHCTDRSGRAD